jgi:membrane-associated phospholipid phosphatase
VEPRDHEFWFASLAAFAGAAILDEPLHSWLDSHQSDEGNRIARVVDPLGRARYLVPSLVGSYAAARLTRHHALANTILRIGLGYAAADGNESILKPAIGRHRPDSTNRAEDFRLYARGEQWHSYPSAHTVHAFSIAAAIADEAHRPWVSLMAYGAASIVGAQRVYTRAHWASDVVLSSTLAIAVSTTTVRWLRSRR